MGICALDSAVVATGEVMFSGSDGATAVLDELLRLTLLLLEMVSVVPELPLLPLRWEKAARMF